MKGELAFKFKFEFEHKLEAADACPIEFRRAEAVAEEDISNLASGEVKNTAEEGKCEINKTIDR